MSYHQYIFGSLVNSTFSNPKLNAFIITGFTCSKQYVKQVVFPNHIWIFLALQGESKIGLLFILKKK